IENIDIGGVTLLRSAAKNYKDVAVTVNPRDYSQLLEELRKNNNEIGMETKLRLAKEAFKHTAKYDYNIYSYFYKLKTENTKISDFPDLEGIRLEKIQDLRYGENPHQQAAFYKELKATNGEKKTGVVNMEQLHGKELSFNNIIDLESAWDIAGEFNSPVAVIIKHTNPCGVATGTKLIDAYQNARKCDPVSAFGSIVGFNREVDKDAADEISKTFVECVIAPSFSAEALQILKKKKNTRLIKMPEISGSNREFDYKKISGGLLIQEKNTDLFKDDLTVVTKRKPAENEMKALQFAWKVCKHVKSNAIVYTTGDRTIGIGAGQMSRVDSAQLAIMKANNA
ncbi:bifunctional phosphoribosylaminoimidazolecarboxamide formyltransferase/IMP cyclohydrolase, partial [bacterium]|nr:bifunctional phosphoribosylaminoimidazolecarboxamide formyltransferase/IMP cyclohydrolase [bacterium]